jgi:hypothetical protein
MRPTVAHKRRARAARQKQTRIMAKINIRIMSACISLAPSEVLLDSIPLVLELQRTASGLDLAVSWRRVGGGLEVKLP